MIKTQNALRTHIGIFGKTNAGKSTLLNLLSGQKSSIVSDIKGTTTDTVNKPMEINGLGPVLFLDTPGYDDESILGKERIEATAKALDKTDLAIFLFSGDLKSDQDFILQLAKNNIPTVFALMRTDLSYEEEYLKELENYHPLFLQKDSEKSKFEIIDAIKTQIQKEERDITGSLVKENSLTLLVMPQDIQAPTGRLIVPQVQTIRELLDKKSVVVAVGLDKLEESLSRLKDAPDLVITDSQCFKEVYDILPKEVRLTSFSVLFSKLKGDVEYFMESAKILDSLSENSRILIAEACTHAPLEEDIGRVKIPKLLRKKYGENLSIDFTRGEDFFEMENYDLIIHCGACMFNRKAVLTRVQKAKDMGIPMTNYGITIAHLKGILDKVVY
ncbi:[FeFe] hydrogenase H-cluster maturation GTPase HydF [Peptoniphilus sp. KCTC 25270]|uniref:[FeFe] hydrogenase H-cluster maturation GTPase HydF n=1 Tax=Peptoniphilus sp. KCTC 25270 TaxID=2897414 RepID=UPI002103F749|nr:[FeFe] hydrogenase H-cluster maturation GTPase HydF [Peptoniphilus sp. KCTC 25270]